MKKGTEQPMKTGSQNSDDKMAKIREVKVAAMTTQASINEARHHVSEARKNGLDYINTILERGDYIETLVLKTPSLEEQSVDFKHSAEELKFKMKYGCFGFFCCCRSKRKSSQNQSTEKSPLIYTLSE